MILVNCDFKILKWLNIIYEIQNKKIIKRIVYLIIIFLAEPYLIRMEKILRVLQV